MRKCAHCAPFEPHHLQNWFDDLSDLTLRHFPTPRLFENSVTDFFILTGFVRKEKSFKLAEINPVAAAFIERALARGIEVTALKGPFGYLTFFRMRIGNRSYEFDRLPGAAVNSAVADDKWLVKKELQALGYPVALGRPFWWFSKKKARRFAEELGYPVVVKPRRGSLSQHLFIAKHESGLLSALENVAAYSPVFMVEKFVPDATLYRATVVDGSKMFFVKRLPPAVLGDGKRTLQELVLQIKFDPKNLDLPLLESQAVTLDSLIPKGTKILLHQKVFLVLGALIKPVPREEVHADIVTMCQNIARHFRSPLMGIDILLRDHARSLRDQTAAVLELNTLPNITMHTVLRDGKKENEVADALVDFALEHC